jgi:hypothetical protein
VTRSFLVHLCAVAGLLAIAAEPIVAQRERTRPRPRGQTTVTESQASELTLTVTEVSVRPIQIWVRTAGVIDDARATVTARLPAAEAARVKVGQRVRAFSPETRSRMHQATVSAVDAGGAEAVIRVTLLARPLEASRHFVLEIVTEEGEFLSVPNESIIETGGRQVVYVQAGGGDYAQRDIQVGVRGELYTQVLGGVTAGDQVVTIGSFFIDAEHKLKGS